MGKVKDGAPAKASKPTKGGPAGGWKRSALFLQNLVSAELYKPRQGWNARLWTAIGLGVIIGLGVVRLYQAINNDYPTLVCFGISGGVGLLFGWLIFRLVQYPPFVEFLIATEAEMNKVSWTSKEDLKRATSVVLVTVTLMSVYLFLVDWVWANLLQILGILKFGGGGAFGSSA